MVFSRYRLAFQRFGDRMNVGSDKELNDLLDFSAVSNTFPHPSTCSGFSRSIGHVGNYMLYNLEKQNNMNLFIQALSFVKFRGAL